MSASFLGRRVRHVSVALATAALVAALFGAVTAASAMVIPLSPEEQARLATTIAVVDIGKSHAHDAAHGVNTNYALTPVSTVKGSAPTSITIAGGKTANFTAWVSDQPVLVPGHRYLMFLDAQGRAYGGVESALPVDSKGHVGPQDETVTHFSARMKYWAKPPAEFKREGKAVPTPPTAADVAASAAAASLPATGAPLLGPVIYAISSDFCPVDTGGDFSISGGAVEILGTGFGSSPGTVSFTYDSSAPSVGSAPSRIVSWSDSRIVAQPEVFYDGTGYPGSAGSGPVSVRTTGGLTATPVSTTLTYSYDGAHWPIGSAVNFKVNPNGVTGATSAVALAAVQAAFTTWSNAGFPLTYTGTTSVSNQAQDYPASGTNNVFWNSTDPEMSGGTLAVTGAYWPNNSPIMFHAFTEFNNHYTWVTSGSNGSSSFDIQTIATHELGHTLHLRDKYGIGDQDQIMYGYNDGSVKRVLSYAEIAAVKHIEGNDLAHPVTTASGIPTDSSAATVTLSGSDSDSGANWGIRYRIDYGPAATYTAPLAIPAGSHSLVYWGIDQAGNPEVPHDASWPNNNVTLPPVTYNPLGGADRYKVAIGISQQSFPGGTNDVVLATGGTFPDALTAASLAGAVDGPVILTRPQTTLSTDVLNEIRRVLTGSLSPHVYIVGGPASVSTGIESQLKARYGTSAVTRLGGADRYEVANNTARRLYLELSNRGMPTPSGAYLVTGASYLDAVLASPLAVHSQWPLLLVGSSLKTSTKNTIADLGFNEIDIIGPTSRVSGSVQSVLGGLVSVVNRPAAGSSFTSQSQAVADYASISGMSRNGMGLASYAGYNDALTAAPMLGRFGSVAYFLPSNSLGSADSAYLSLHKSEIDTVFFLGGIGSIPQSERDQVAAALRP